MTSFFIMRVSLLRRYEELSDSKSWISKELLSSVVTQEELPPISEMKSDAIQLT